MRKINRALMIMYTNGIYNGLKIIINKIRNKPNILSIEGKIKILWFIPDFGIGSGGHLNIFRMILNLTKNNIISDIVICGESQYNNEKIAKDIIDKYFFVLECKVYFAKNQNDMKFFNKYHYAMATSWQTAYYVNTFSNCINKSYFVQDFEPYFFPKGSNYIFSENTYNFDFYGIAAGSWISKKLVKEYNMECISFSFSYDKNLYFKQNKHDSTARVFFYARPPTDRRGFELGIIALKKLYETINNIEIILAGWDTSDYSIPFKHINPGIVSISDLSKLYSQCDVALVLSYTNLSLLPLELLASGCPVVINRGQNNSWIDPKYKLFNYCENNFDDIVLKLINILNGIDESDQNFIHNFLSKSSWENESNIVAKQLHKWLDK